MRRSLRTRCLVAAATMLAAAASLALAGCKISPSPQAPARPAPRPTSPAPTPAVTATPKPTETAPAAPATQAESGPATALPVPTGLPASPTLANAPGAVPTFVTPPADPGAPPEPDFAARNAEVQARVDAVRAWLNRTQRGGVLLSDPRNVAWLTLGGSGAAGPGRPDACVAVLSDRVLVVAPNDGIAAALAAFRPYHWNGRTYRWDLGADAAAPARAVQPLLGTRVLAADEHRGGTEFVGEELAELRLRLSGSDEKRLLWLGATAANVLSAALGTATGDQTESKLAAAITAGLNEKGIAAAWLRVVALDRLDADGLAAPGETRLASGAAVQLVATRWGLCATVGRTVTPQPQAAAVEDFVLARRLYASLLSRAAEGAGLAELYRAADRAAAEAGVAEAFHANAPAGVGAYEPLSRPASPDAVSALAVGDVLTLTVRLPRAYLADTVVLGAGGTALATGGGSWPSPPFVVAGKSVPVPTLRGGEQAVAEAEQARVGAEARLRATAWLGKLLTSAVAEVRATAPKPPAPAKAVEGPKGTPAAEGSRGAEPAKPAPSPAPKAATP